MATARNLIELAPVGERKPKRLFPPVWEGVEYPHYPPGVYDVRCNRIQGPEWLNDHRRWSLRVECNFLFEEGNVSGFLNMGDDPKRCSARRQSKYYKLWCMANGDTPGRDRRWIGMICSTSFFASESKMRRTARANRCQKRSVTQRSSNFWSALDRESPAPQSRIC